MCITISIHFMGITVMCVLSFGNRRYIFEVLLQRQHLHTEDVKELQVKWALRENRN